VLEKECKFCGNPFKPSKGSWKRQKSCKSKGCEKARKAENNRLYKEKNPDCFKGRYENLKEWRKANPGYQREWYQKNKCKKKVNREKTLKIQANDFIYLIDSIDKSLNSLRKIQVTGLVQGTDIQETMYLSAGRT